MSSILGDPFPHAQVYTSGFPVTLNPPARALLLTNFSAAASSITITTISGEVLTIPLGNTSAQEAPVYLPIQTAVINAVSNLGAVTALWH
jgi:hypothetical protein